MKTKRKGVTKPLSWNRGGGGGRKDEGCEVWALPDSYPKTVLEKKKLDDRV